MAKKRPFWKKKCKKKAKKKTAKKKAAKKTGKKTKTVPVKKGEVPRDSTAAELAATAIEFATKRNSRPHCATCTCFR